MRSPLRSNPFNRCGYEKILILAAGLAILSGCTRDASFPGEGENPQASKAAASVVTYSITGRISFSQGWKVEDVVLPTGQTGVPPGPSDTVTVIESTGYTAHVELSCEPWPGYGEIYLPYSNGQQAVILSDYQQWNFPCSSPSSSNRLLSGMWINGYDPYGEVAQFRVNYTGYDQFGNLSDTYSAVLPTRQPTSGVSLPDNPFRFALVLQPAAMAAHHGLSGAVRSDRIGQRHAVGCHHPAGAKGILTGNGNPTLFSVTPGMSFSPVRDGYYTYTKGDFSSGPGSAVSNEIRITLTRSGNEWIIEATQNVPDRDVVVTCDGWDVLSATYVIPQGQTLVRTGPADAGYVITDVYSYGSKYTFVW
ncbi:MAG: hypothetical protein ACLR8Y_09335 [Alistipes indistinctus]